MTDFLDKFSSASDRVMSALMQPTQFFQDPSKRVFWLYLFIGLVIAALVCIARYRGRWFQYLYRQLLAPKLWFHPSSLLDYKLVFVKALFQVFLFATWFASSYAIALGLVQYANGQFGALAIKSVSDWTITVTYTVVLFICSDLSRYLVHRLCHEIPILWQFHQVHHSAEVMTPLTLYRSHPVENLIFVLRGIVVTGLITGLFFYLFGSRAVQMQLLGVNILGLLFNMLGANLRHSHVWISYGSLVERVLLSPAQHQIHHSDHPRHHGTNYGSCLAIWDWFGGSLHIARGQETITFGLSDSELNHNPHGLTSALIGPFRGCWTLVRSWYRHRRAEDQKRTDVTLMPQASRSNEPRHQGSGS